MSPRFCIHLPSNIPSWAHVGQPSLSHLSTSLSTPSLSHWGSNFHGLCIFEGAKTWKHFKYLLEQSTIPFRTSLFVTFGLTTSESQDLSKTQAASCSLHFQQHLQMICSTCYLNPTQCLSVQNRSIILFLKICYRKKKSSLKRDERMKDVPMLRPCRARLFPFPRTESLLYKAFPCKSENCGPINEKWMKHIETA